MEQEASSFGNHRLDRTGGIRIGRLLGEREGDGGQDH